MHMVVHNTKSVQFEDVSIAVMQTVYHQLGNSRIAEPTRTTGRRIQRCIPLAEYSPLFQVGLPGAFVAVGDSFQCLFAPSCFFK